MIEVVKESVPLLAFGAVSLPILVWLIVNTMVYVGLLKTGQQKRIANVVLSLLGGIMWVVNTLVPSTLPVTIIVVTAIAGSLGSALLYTKFDNSGNSG